MIIGSRGSQLALWQARWIQQHLPGSEIVIIKTTGDRITGPPLPEVSVKGMFTKEIEEALLDHRIDVAVHSLKDLPTEIDARLALAAVPAREEVRDALVGHTLASLPPGACVGTGSLRRASQLLHRRPGLYVENVRGNVDTRLRKLDEGRYDALVLAAAGLRRLGLAGRIAELLPVDVMCPAIGQGALGIETRADDAVTRRALAPLEDPTARAAITAERALLAALGGGCQVPIGGTAWLAGDRLHLTAVVASPDGAQLVRVAVEGCTSDPAGLGRFAAAELLAKGARQLLEQVPAR
jgi:hydroxymethylbilane synthase